MIHLASSRAKKAGKGEGGGGVWGRKRFRRMSKFKDCKPISSQATVVQ